MGRTGGMPLVCDTSAGDRAVMIENAQDTCDTSTNCDLTKAKTFFTFKQQHLLTNLLCRISEGALPNCGFHHHWRAKDFSKLLHFFIIR